MKKTANILAIIILVCPSIVIGQNQLKNDIVPLRSSSEATADSYSSVNLPKLVPVSPNAASLGIYGAIPVGHYTGVPNISIPIYEINLDGKTFPVNISYHASGIKVAQEASTVGLGWALNAGGCIIKEIRGWDDFEMNPTGYHWDTNFPSSDANNNLNQQTVISDEVKYGRFLQNETDPEPDLFHYNFGPFSGTMFFNKSNSPNHMKAVLRKEEQYLDAIYHNNGYWIISDADGYKYYFNTQKKSLMYVYQTNNYKENLTRSLFHPGEKQANVTTAWYLDSIVSPNHNKISFSYTTDRLYTPFSSSEDVSYLLAVKDTIIEGSGQYSPKFGIHRNYNYSFSENEQVRITCISFNGGTVSFNYSDRLDIEPVYPNNKVKKLNSIELNNTQIIVKKITFIHSYLGNTNSPSTCRLMLDTLKIGINNETQNHAFTYNRNNLPSKQSQSTDYWDYYNLSGNQTDSRFYLSPSAEALFENKSEFFIGRNKTAWEPYIQNGTLTAIQYPTGRKTVFEYEIHDFSNYFLAYDPYKQSVSKVFHDTQEPPEYVGDDFELLNKKRIYLNLTSYLCNPSLNGSVETIKLYVERKQSNNIYYQEAVYPITVEVPDNKEIIRTLPAGTYQIRMDGIAANSNTCIYVTANEIYLDNINKGGGLRAKAITDYVSNRDYVKKEFIYKLNGQSTGILMTKPEHHRYYALEGGYRSYINDPIFGGGKGINVVYAALYLNGFSSPNTPFGNSAMGRNVGYSYVEEKVITSNDNNGFTSYKFENRADSIINLSDRYIAGYQGIANLNNGSPLEISFYNKNKSLIKKEKYEYLKTKSSSIKGVKVQNPPMVIANVPSYIKFYDLYSERWELNKKTDSLLFNNQWLTTSTEYQYDNFNGLVRNEKVYDSRNDAIETHILYPHDYTSDPYTSMVSNRILSPVIEKTRYRNNQLIHKTITEYKNWENNIFAPKFIKFQANTQSPPLPRITYYNYDSYGNPLYITKDEIEKVVYLWGYKGQYPIAEIKNLTYSEVMAKLAVFGVSESSFDNVLVAAIHSYLRNNTFSSAQVTTYTYQPLVGITSIIAFCFVGLKARFMPYKREIK
jgi:hypothetical protein